MENASKALIMAGTILIAILVLTVGVYIFMNFSEFTRESNEKQAKQELIMENNKFLKYDGRKDLKVQDMKSVTNLVKEYNNKCLAGNEITNVFCGSRDLLLWDEAMWFKEFEKDTNNSNEGKIQEYTCTIEMQGEFVKKITFKMN